MINIKAKTGDELQIKKACTLGKSGKLSGKTVLKTITEIPLMQVKSNHAFDTNYLCDSIIDFLVNSYFIGGH